MILSECRSHLQGVWCTPNRICLPWAAPHQSRPGDRSPNRTETSGRCDLPGVSFFCGPPAGAANSAGGVHIVRGRAGRPPALDRLQGVADGAVWPANAIKRPGRWSGEIAGKSAVSGQSWRPCPGPDTKPGKVMLEEWRPRKGRPVPPAGRWGASPGVDPPEGCPMVPAPAARHAVGPKQGPYCTFRSPHQQPNDPLTGITEYLIIG